MTCIGIIHCNQGIKTTLPGVKINTKKANTELIFIFSVVLPYFGVTSFWGSPILGYMYFEDREFGLLFFGPLV